MKDVQCYEIFGGIALKNHAFSFLSVSVAKLNFTANVCHLQLPAETLNLLHMLVAQAHELGLPCVICEFHIAMSTICLLHLLVNGYCMTFRISLIYILWLRAQCWSLYANIKIIYVLQSGFLCLTS